MLARNWSPKGEKARSDVAIYSVICLASLWNGIVLWLAIGPGEEVGGHLELLLHNIIANHCASDNLISV